FIIGSSPRRLQKNGVRFRARLTGADARTAHFADGSTLDAGVVIWATGYRPDYSWIRVPGVAQDGQVAHRRGVTDVPGLYFLGLPCQPPGGSPLSAFANEAAPSLASRIAAHRRATDTAASGPVPSLQAEQR